VIFDNSLHSQKVGPNNHVFLWKKLVSQPLFEGKFKKIKNLNLVLEIVQRINGAQETVGLLK
jgi:hypothetical protein